MPEIDNKILAIKNHLFFIPLLFIIIACSAGNNTPANNPVQSGNYSFAKLIAHNSFYTPPPANICSDIPINRDPNLQPPQAKCELGNSPAQIAYGCDVNIANPNSLGVRLARSVVGIAIPTSKNSWELRCTGTIIESKWVLTAAHCLANEFDDNNGGFIPEVKNLVVVPWQSAYNGVPKQFNNESTNVTKFLVKAIYISYYYNHYDESYNTPYDSYIKDDFALLELESSLSGNYETVAIESVSLSLPKNTTLWSAGYGINESQKPDGQLHFHNIYYYSNRYDTSTDAWPESLQPGPVSGDNGIDYGMIYTLGSIQESTENQPPSAWSFLGSGDSGGPLLYYNNNTQKFSILATLTGGLYCQYAGFYAPLPYSFDQYTAMTESRYALIQQIINKTANHADVSCVSKDNSCYPKMVYVLNQKNNSISIYRSDQNNNLHYMNEVNTGTNPQAFTLDKTHSYILIANYGDWQSNGSISIFKIRLDGLFSNYVPDQFNNALDKPISIITNYYIDNDGTDYSIYVANQGNGITNSSISKLEINHYNGTLSVISNKIMPDHNLARIKFVAGRLYAFYTTDNKIIMLDKDLKIWNTMATDFDLPTDLAEYEINQMEIPFIVNSGNNSILNQDSGESDDSGGTRPYQIAVYKTPDIARFYVTNLESNNIARFKFGNTPDSPLSFESKVATGRMPIGMTIAESQMFIVNKSDNTLWQYNILSNGNLQFKQSVATGQEPVAVLANY